MLPELTTTRPADRFITFSHALLFVTGFSLIFIVGWGGAVTLLGQLFGEYRTWLAQAGGVLVILFGLYTLDLLRLPWLDADTRPAGWGAERSGYLASLLLGVAFAAGWTPCIGTILGAILTLGLSQQTAGQAMILSSGYALGLALPFLAISLLMDRAVLVTRRLRRYTRQVRMMSGLLLVVMGILLLTNQMFYIAIWAQRYGLYLDIQANQAGTPTYLIAVAAGLLSFLSPCVLPLVPAYVSYLGGHAVRETR